MSQPSLVRVERACAQLLQAGRQVTFTAVADLAGVSRTTLYRDADLRAVIDEHRTRQADARSLTGLASEIAHLRTALEAVADNVRRHEEQLRRLERRTSRKTG
jgi:predicted DNA-binding transcriptional regulator YafY